MFQGEYEYSLDDKSRVILPASLRKGIEPQVLEGGFTLANGDKSECLELHLQGDWEKRVQEEMRLYKPSNLAARDYFRDLLSSAFEVTLDRSHRFIIPEQRKQDAGITKDVVFVGMWTNIEIWDKERWVARKAARTGQQARPDPDRE